MAYKLISKQTLTSNTTTVTFSSIPQTYKDLQLISMVRGTDTSASILSGRVRFNGSTSNLYSQEVAAAYPAPSITFSPSGNQNITAFTELPVNSGFADTWVYSMLDIYIAGYFSTSHAKPCIAEVAAYGTSSVTYASYNMNSMTWDSASAITSIDLYLNAGQWASGSSFWLYGI